MLKDIHHILPTGIRIVLTIQPENTKAPYQAYIINDNAFDIQTVLIASKGYGVREGRHAITAPLRRFFEQVEAGKHEFIETVPEQYLDLYNEFWVSYYVDGKMHDGQFVFIPNCHLEHFHTEIPEFNCLGVVAGLIQEKKAN